MARLALLALLILAVGCGGDDGRLSREEFAEQADSICRTYQERADVSSVTTAEAFVAAADRTLAAFDDAMRELRELEPPEDEEQLVEQWFAQLAVLRSDVEKMRDRARDGDLQAVRELAPLGLEHNRQANRTAERLGMRVCSTG